MASYLQSSGDLRCLILGDGDFSFTCDFLQLYHLHYSQITTSTLESREEVLKKKNGKESLEQVESYKNATLLFSLDATKLHMCDGISSKFDRVIFNFPHVGGKSNIGANRRLLKSFLHSSSLCLREQGAIEVALCQGQGGTAGEVIQREYNNTWKVVEMAAESGLVLSDLKLFSPSNYPNYTQTGFRSRDIKFHLERSLVHSFVSHCDHTDPPLLHTLLQWKQLIPLCPYPLMEVGDLLIPFELRNKFNRSLWDTPKHPIQQITSIFLNILDNHLSHCCLKRGDTLSPSPLLSPTQLDELHLSPVFLSQLHSRMYKCYKASHSKNYYSELFLTPSLTFHLPTLLHSTLYTPLPNMSVLVGDTYQRCGISHLSSLQNVSNQLMLLLTRRHSDSVSMNNILLQVISQMLNSTSSRPAPVWSVATTPYDDILENTLELRCGDIVLASVSSLRGAYIDRQEVYKEVCVLYLDTLVTLLYKLDDVRLLWSRSSRVYSFFEKLSYPHQDASEHTPPNLHPLRLQHDLCFWHPWDRTIPECDVATAVRCYCEDYSLSATLFNEFTCPLNRLSHNYRLVLQSCDFCLSRSRAHQLQSMARELLRDFYGVELR